MLKSRVARPILGAERTATTRSDSIVPLMAGAHAMAHSFDVSAADTAPPWSRK